MLCKLVHGRPLKIKVDLAVDASVEAGELSIVGTQARIATVDAAYADGQPANFAVSGAVYKAPKAVGAGEAIADGVDLYFNSAGDVAFDTVTAGKKLGKTVRPATDSDPYVFFELGAA